MGSLGFPTMVKWKSEKLEPSCSRKPFRLSTADVPSNEVYRQFFCCSFIETNLAELKEVAINSSWKEKHASSTHNTKEVVRQCYYHCLLTQQVELLYRVEDTWMILPQPLNMAMTSPTAAELVPQCRGQPHTRINPAWVLLK